MSQTVTLTAPPGYGRVVPFDKNRHAGLGLKPARDYRWCRELNAVLLSAAEFGRAALDYPIGYLRDPRGELAPAAILGLQARQNLFVDGQGRWHPQAYIPAALRRYPFCLAEVAPGDGQAPQQMVCVQEDQLEASGRPLLDAKGEPTAEWQPIQKLLEAMEGTRAATRALTQRLENLNLLVPFDALALPREGPQLRLQGLFRVDEAKLNKLPGRELRALAAKGELRAVYAHLLSLENFARLLDMAQQSRGSDGN
ncbi:MAG: SapC family protein [Gammaproteobacteria bacterium]|nr:SapC family protein [Gammaproteobacteria bacterium]